MNKSVIFLLVLVALAVIAALGLVGKALAPSGDESETLTKVCAADAMICPDGSAVGRTGPNCEFVCPVVESTTTDSPDTSESLADQIVVVSPVSSTTISSPLSITGQARGPWFFEASFPVSLIDSNNVTIATGIATATSDWMTEEFVPFTATLNFTSPYQTGDPTTMSQGTLILKKDNPSGLPEHDATLEIPVVFSPV